MLDNPAFYERNFKLENFPAVFTSLDFHSVENLLRILYL